MKHGSDCSFNCLLRQLCTLLLLTNNFFIGISGFMGTGLSFEGTLEKKKE